jgi:hypothetical protein
VAAIKFMHPSDRVMRTARELISEPHQREALSEEELEVEVWAPHPGGPDQLQLLEISYPPNITASPHAHESDEIVVVVRGEMRFGNNVCGVGSSAMIPAYTLYSFVSGPEGVTFLNFRGRSDTSLLTPKVLRGRRSGEQTA